MKVYKPEWQCTFSVNEGAEESANWKERIAWRLRGFADRLAASRHRWAVTR